MPRKLFSKEVSDGYSENYEMWWKGTQRCCIATMSSHVHECEDLPLVGESSYPPNDLLLGAASVISSAGWIIIVMWKY